MSDSISSVTEMLEARTVSLNDKKDQQRRQMIQVIKLCDQGSASRRSAENNERTPHVEFRN